MPTFIAARPALPTSVPEQRAGGDVRRVVHAEVDARQRHRGGAGVERLGRQQRRERARRGERRRGVRGGKAQRRRRRDERRQLLEVRALAAHDGLQQRVERVGDEHRARRAQPVARAGGGPARRRRGRARARSRRARRGARSAGSAARPRDRGRARAAGGTGARRPSRSPARAARRAAGRAASGVPRGRRRAARRRRAPDDLSHASARLSRPRRGDCPVRRRTARPRFVRRARRRGTHRADWPACGWP